MKIITLLENDSISSDLCSAHGLSLYIETANHRILFDLGPNECYIENAHKLGVDIKDVDIVILSHGHNDHGTGLEQLLLMNPHTVVYASASVFEEHVKQVNDKYVNIGVDVPSHMERIHLIHKDTIIDDEIELIVEVPFIKNIIEDTALFTYRNGNYIRDTFDHELYLVLHENENHVLISGCSHKGIEHIIDTIEKEYHFHCTHVLGGYHFSHYDTTNTKQREYLSNLADKFLNRGATEFYSCHCTGEEAFLQLQSRMKSKLQRVKTGEIINI